MTTIPRIDDASRRLYAADGKALYISLVKDRDVLMPGSAAKDDKSTYEDRTTMFNDLKTWTVGITST